MDIAPAPDQVEDVIAQIDRLIADMMLLRSRVSALSAQPGQPERSVRDAEYFGIWADREDMRGLSSRVWLERLRSREWARP